MESIQKIHIGKLIRQYIIKNNVSRTNTARKMGLPNTVSMPMKIVCRFKPLT